MTAGQYAEYVEEFVEEREKVGNIGFRNIYILVKRTEYGGSSV